MTTEHLTEYHVRVRKQSCKQANRLILWGRWITKIFVSSRFCFLLKKTWINMIELDPKCLNIHSHRDLKSLSFSTDSGNVLLPTTWSVLTVVPCVRRSPWVTESSCRGLTSTEVEVCGAKFARVDEHCHRRTCIVSTLWGVPLLKRESWQMISNPMQPQFNDEGSVGSASRTSSLHSSWYQEPSQTCRSKSVQDTGESPLSCPHFTSLYTSPHVRFGPF